MKITESQLRKIVREEILGKGLVDPDLMLPTGGSSSDAIGKRLGFALRKHKFPGNIHEFDKNANVVFHEFETRGADSFKNNMEDNFGSSPMPVEFYADVVLAMKADEKAYWKNKDVSGRGTYSGW